MPSFHSNARISMQKKKKFKNPNVLITDFMNNATSMIVNVHIKKEFNSATFTFNYYTNNLIILY